MASMNSSGVNTSVTHPARTMNPLSTASTWSAYCARRTTASAAIRSGRDLDEPALAHHAGDVRPEIRVDERPGDLRGLGGLEALRDRLREIGHPELVAVRDHQGRD